MKVLPISSLSYSVNQKQNQPQPQQTSSNVSFQRGV